MCTIKLTAIKLRIKHWIVPALKSLASQLYFYLINQSSVVKQTEFIERVYKLCEFINNLLNGKAG